jgi:hypothetical protein
MTRTKRAGVLAAVVAAAAGAFACDGIPSINEPRPRLHDCPLRYSPLWPKNRARVLSNYAAKCPLALPGTYYPVSYSGTVQATRGYHNNEVSLDFVNKKGVVLFSNTARFYEWAYASGRGDDTLDVMQVATRYFAATGNDAFESGVDSAYHGMTFFEANGGRPVYAVLDLEYAIGPGARLQGPGAVLPSEPIVLTASIHDARMVHPLTYSWTQNGSPVYGDSVLQTSATVPGGNVFQVTISDPLGHSQSAEVTVMAKTCDTPGCNDQ